MNNVIVAAFGASRTIKTRPVYMMDHGMILQFSGIELPENFEVHFANSKSGTAKIQLGNAQKVSIPDEYFNAKNYTNIYAWVYLHSGNDDGFTAYEVEIPLIQRPAATDEQPTPDEQNVIEQAVIALNNATEYAKEIANKTEQIAEAIPNTVNSALQEAKESGVFDGAPGPQRDAGADGISPTATVTKDGKTTTITLTDKNGSTTATVEDGEISAEDFYKAFPTDTASGAIASFDDGADGIPVKSLTVNIEPVQEGEGDPSPENVRPIHGWTAVTVRRYGADKGDSLKTISIDFGEAGTVYGGTLDVTTGELVADRHGVIFDGNEQYTNAYFPTIVCKAALPYRGDFASNRKIVCSHTASVGFASNSATTIQFSRADMIFGVNNAEEFRTMATEQAANGTPIMVVYPLKAPITYQLTPVQVKTLLGANNIYADCGTVDVTFRADPTLYINNKLAELQAMILEKE